MRQSLADRKLLLFLVMWCTLSIKPVFSQYSHTVVPIGNFVDVPDVRTFGQSLSHLLDSVGGRQTLLFTGDITGSSKHNFITETNRIDTLLSILKPLSTRKIIFIPGDRDWADSGPLGWEQLNLLEEYIRGLNREDVEWPLRHGCPGPEKLELDLGLNLVVLNTQWWNHPYQKPIAESATCELATHEEVMDEIERYIEDTRFGNIIFAGHFPVRSGGTYGGHYPLTDWLFPVPVVSTMVTAHKQNVGSPYEICNGRYSQFREDMQDILAEYPSMIYVSGHEKNREMLSFNDNVLVQSGAPEKGDYVSRSSATLFASKEPGLIALHYDMDGNVWATTYTLQGTTYQFDERIKLLQAPCRTPMAGVPVNQRLVPCLDDKYVLPHMETTPPATVTVTANPTFGAKGFKKFILGEHYRKTWITPVEIPYLNLDTYADGLIPYLEGGGRQTQSLRFAGINGREYVMRSVDKDPSKSLSYSLRESLLSLVVRDQTTTEHPYGALVSSYLLDKLDILHPQPELYVIPDDPKLGPFQKDFGDMFGMLEERPSGRKQIEKTFADADEILGSTEMFRELYKDRDNAIQSDEYARARVFDILVGDWSKHEDNWKWAGYKDGIVTEYRPVPRDRDHVFSRWDGVLPWLIDREWAKPAGENFDYRLKGMRSLMFQARHLDRFLANEMTRQDWVSAAEYIRTHLTSEDFDSAIAVLPKEVRNISGPEIAAKLVARMKDLDGYAEEYYDMLAKQVDVCGSNKTELFDVTRNADGTVDVSMYKIKKGIKDKQFYSRRFYPNETKEIRLFGMQGDDVFHIDGMAHSSILVRVVSGAGVNEIVDSSEVDRGGKLTRIYSLNNTDHITEGPETRMVHIPYPEAYQYRRTAFKYNTYTPIVYLLSTSGNGITVGLGVSFMRQAYDKPDYSAIHNIGVQGSSLGNLRFEYDGRSRHVLGTWDLTYAVLLDKHRRLNYFFGTGNNTTLDPDLLRDLYYTLQFSSLQVSAGLSKKFWERSHLDIGVTMLGSGRENLGGNILETGNFPDVAGLERLRIVKGHVGFDLDLRDQPNLPQRGMRLAVEGVVAEALNEKMDYANARTSLEYFTTFRPFTLGLRVGGAVHTGVTPFFDLQYLGHNSNLRGFRQNRFTGHSLAFFNSELRVQLVNNPHALIPYKLGVIAFFDTGRIFGEPEPANDVGWHQGYGGGIYFVPIRDRFLLHISMGFSDEESGLLKFGFGHTF